MNNRQDIPLSFHKSLNSLIDSFSNVLASLAWLKASGVTAEEYFRPYPYVMNLNCTVTDKVLKVDKSILTRVANESINQKTPLSTNTIINFCRVVTIASKDIVWNEPDFESLLQKDELQFLRHIRNASAHENKFFFGNGKHREKTLEMLPVLWRNKVISDTTEGSQLFMEFMSAGDLLFLLSDISSLVPKEK